MSSEGEVWRVHVAFDRPSGGMWPCGPNPCWVTVTHLPTMISARAYHLSQRKAREMARTCVELMLAEAGESSCSFPDVIGVVP